MWLVDVCTSPDVVISVVHLLIVASEAVAYTELLRSPNRPQPSLARPPRVWLEIALCGVVFVAVGIKAYEHEHNLVFLVKMLAWLFTAHVMYLKAYRTDMGDLQLEAATVPTPVNVLDQGVDQPKHVLQGCEWAMQRHTAQLVREFQWGARRRLQNVRMWFIVAALATSWELREPLSAVTPDPCDVSIFFSSWLVALVGFIGLSACCAREARGATTRDAVRLGTAEGFRDKVDEAAVRVQQQLALKHRRKMRAIIWSVGTRGDVQPFVALALALQARGHSVCLCATGKFKEFVESHGVEYADCGEYDIVHSEEWHAAKTPIEMMHASMDSFKVLPHKLRTTLKVMKGEHRADAEPADVMIGSLTTVQDLLTMSEAINVPVWAAKMQADVPTVAMSDLSSGREHLLGWHNYAVHVIKGLQLVLGVRKLPMLKIGQEFRKDIGLPAAVPTMERYQDCVHLPTMFLSSPALLPKPLDYPRWHWSIGPFLLDGDARQGVTGGGAGAGAGATAASTAKRGLPSDLEAFMREGDANEQPTVCVTFGSMVLKSRAAIVANAVRAVLDLGHRCVFISGGTDKAAVDVQTDHPNLFIIKAVPHDLLFPRCTAVVHHGGCGTLNRCVHSGVPSVVHPILLWSDQPFWGHRAQLANLAVVVKQAQPSVGAFRDAIKKVIDDTTIRETASRVAAESAAEAAVDKATFLLESCLCRMILEPQAANEVMDERVPVDELSLQQRMCRRHCVMCHIDRTAEHRGRTKVERQGQGQGNGGAGGAREQLRRRR